MRTLKDTPDPSTTLSRRLAHRYQLAAVRIVVNDYGAVAEAQRDRHVAAYAKGPTILAALEALADELKGARAA